ncbi:MAG: metabolite traffic protein EboE [bacterium]
MLLRHKPPLHLTYCLNVHPGERWDENLAAIQTHAMAIRNRVAPGKRFGLGLRLSHQAAITLRQPESLAAFKRFLDEHDLYAFTINGFPYGAFHGQEVKTAVYRPDWSNRDRLDYTTTLACIMASLLPEGTDGNISTVPLGYKFGRGNSNDTTPAAAPTPAMAIHLAECAATLHDIRMTTGKDVHIGLEPEPDCLLETTEEVIRFFEGHLLLQAIPHLVSRLSCSRHDAEMIVRRHIGICFDTCHMAIQFEGLAESLTRLVRHGIRISKVQLSSALEVLPTITARARLKEFLDPVYLHQVKEVCLDQNTGGEIQGYEHDSVNFRRYNDLDAALESPIRTGSPAALWRIHYHVPLYFESDATLHSTSNTLDVAFWNKVSAIPVTHLEIETYTFHHLPPHRQIGGIVTSVVREYEWVTSRLSAQTQTEYVPA